MAGTITMVGIDESDNLVTLKVATDGSLSLADAAFATKVTASGGYTYIGEALPGTAEAAEAWRCQRIDSSGTTLWANGDGKFDNVATDLTALSYS